MRAASFACVRAVLSSCLLVAASAGAAEPMLGRVAVVGTSPSTATTLSQVLLMREGVLLNRDTVRGDLRRIFATGLVADAQASTSQLKDGTTVLRYRVVECPRLVDIDLKGVDPGDRAEDFDPFKDYLLTRLGQPTCVRDIRTELEKVRRKYVAEGLPNAKFTVDAPSMGRGAIAAHVKIEYGEPLIVEAIAFNGVSAQREAELRPLLSTCLGSPRSETRTAYDTGVINSYFYDRGYINVATRPVWSQGVITWDVQEGEVYRLGQLTFTGVKLGTDAELLPLLGAKPAEIFSRSKLADGLRVLVQHGKERGLSVEVTPVTAVDNDRRTIDLNFQIERR
jgi:outer membrane protein insertion porin family